MSVYATRRIRNLAATLMMLSGISHLGQLWLRQIDAPALVTALFGVLYLILALGLFGQSRFTLWASALAMSLGAMLSSTALNPDAPDPLLIWHLGVDAVVVPLCLYTLFRTRFDVMD